MRHLALPTALAFLLAGLAGCGDPTPADNKLKAETGEAWDAMKTWGAEKRDALTAKASDGLKSLEKPLADAKAAAGAAGSDASRALDGAWKTTQEKLAALKEASGEGYAKARDEFLSAYASLKQKLGKK